MNTMTSSNLCIKCGICCDGSAFGRVPLESSNLSGITQQMNLREIESKQSLKNIWLIK